MSELTNSAAKTSAPDDRRLYGAVIAEVIENCDLTRLGRVQLRLPWLPGYQPWARVAAPMTGDNAGAYMMPQVGDEVLVMFNHGDVREPYVIGCLWNSKKRAPVISSGDAKVKWIIRTPKGHEIVFDEQAQLVRIKSLTGQRVTLTDERIDVSMDDKDSTAISLDKHGNITIKARQTITLDAPVVEIKSGDKVSIQSGVGKPGAGVTQIHGGAQCTIDAMQINIG